MVIDQYLEGEDWDEAPEEMALFSREAQSHSWPTSPQTAMTSQS